jgi:hypothetical protein
LKVYFKRVYISLVVVVNGAMFLWIRPKNRAESSVWKRYNPLIACVCDWQQFWTKIGMCIKPGLSTNGTCGYPVAYPQLVNEAVGTQVPAYAVQKFKED